MKLAIAALLVGVAPAQTVYHFTHTDSIPAFREAGNNLRSIADLPDVSIDETARTLTVNGTVSQLGIAAWLFPLAGSGHRHRLASVPGAG